MPCVVRYFQSSSQSASFICISFVVVVVLVVVAWLVLPVFSFCSASLVF